MNDETLRSAYAELLAMRAGDRSACVTAAALLAVVERSGAESERLATLRHVASCKNCRAELELLRTAGDVAERVARPVWRSVPMLAAASVLLIASSVVLWQATRASLPDTLRGPTAEDVRQLAPESDVAAALPVTLVWGGVADARRYEVEVLRPDESVAFSASMLDTMVVLREDAGLSPNVDYRWWVRAVLADGTTQRSPLRALRLRAP